ncbi:hypothetical protein GWI33_022438 [Rhynchophorus ferrugineus]|uniref:Uncharacterized protein n=1 Tax=Rhynchophorus ferrugineus TaxID=354439 RepID=A0A834J0E0_RHYFE|nr:hypothetical protein GWI33_022438 [Rhynchophorus ferrugineus]
MGKNRETSSLEAGLDRQRPVGVFRAMTMSYERSSQAERWNRAKAGARHRRDGKTRRQGDVAHLGRGLVTA